MRCSLWQDRKGTERVEDERTSVVVSHRVDVVLEGKLNGVGFARGDRSLGRRAQQRTGGKRATAGWRVIDRGPVELDAVQVAIRTLRPGDGQPRHHLVHRRIVLDAHRDVLLAQRLASDN